MAETTTIETWLYGLLSGDVTLVNLTGGRIYGYLAPQSATFPLVIFQYQGGSDVFGVGPIRFTVNGLWLVKAIDQQASFDGLKTIADRIDTLLHAKGSGTVWACVREQPFSLVEILDGVQYRHLGGIYRIMAS